MILVLHTALTEFLGSAGSPFFQAKSSRYSLHKVFLVSEQPRQDSPTWLWSMCFNVTVTFLVKFLTVRFATLDDMT